MGVTAKNLKMGPANVYLFAVPRAVLVTALAAAHSNLRFEARNPGAGGNAISVEYAVAGLSTPLSVAVAGSLITVNVETDGAGLPLSTADQVRDAIRNHLGASGLVKVMRKTGDNGTGVVDTLAPTLLAGGSDVATPVDVGALGEGVQVVIATEVSPLTAAQTGNIAQDEVVSGGRFEITVPFRELTLENLQLAIPGAELFDDGAVPPKRRLEFTVPVGCSLRSRATRMELRPLQCGGESANPEDILVINEASPVAGEPVIAYHPTEQRELAATFRAWPDSRGRFGSYGDQEF